MKRTKIMLILVYIVALVVFLIINQMTPRPGTSSGNGNPALLLAWILLLLFYFIVILWIRIFREHSINIYVFVGCIFGIIGHQIIAFFYQKSEWNEYRQVIKNAIFKRYGTVDEEYLHTITNGLSIHVNNQYFNYNTYFMFVTFSLFVSIVCILLEKQKEKYINQ